MEEIPNQYTAARGEELAAAWLLAEGWEIRHRNWKKKLGEIDIVATRPVEWGDEQISMIAFVEVKSCEQSGDILPEVHVNHHKRSKLVALAKLYLAAHDLRDVTARFDVIGVDVAKEEIRHYPAAFDGSGRLR